MKKLLILLTILVILPLFTLKVGAEDAVDDFISEFEDTLPEELAGLSGDADFTLSRIGIRGIIEEIISTLSGKRGALAELFLTLLGVIALTSVASLVGGELSRSAECAVGLVGSILIFPRISGVISGISASLGQINDLFAAVMPITVGITALGGGEKTALVQGGGMSLTLSLLGGLGGRVFTALSAFGLALALLSPLGGDSLSAVGRGVKTLFTRLLGIFTALITGVFSLQTLVASTADSGAMRAAKYMASGLIPVVGTTVSGALSTLASGLSYAKGVVGGGAVAAVLILALSPLTVLLAYRFVLSVCSTLASTVSPSASRIITSYRSAMDMTLAVYALSVVIYLFELIVFIKMGVALA